MVVDWVVKKKDIMNCELFWTVRNYSPDLIGSWDAVRKSGKFSLTNNFFGNKIVVLQNISTC